jgi:hypothetical protein
MMVVMRRLVSLCCAALAFTAPAFAAQGYAGTIVVKLTLVPGTLAARAAPVAVTAAESIRVPVTIADGRGNGRGWTLRVSAERSVTITEISAQCAPNSTCRLPIAATSPAGNVVPGNVVLRAARGTGMGVMHLVVTVAALQSGAPATPLSFTIS